MKHQKRMKKGFSLAMSEADHKATLWVRDLSQVIVMWYKDNPGQQDKRTTDNKGFTSMKKMTALNGFFPIPPFSASLSKQVMTSLFGSCPKNILS
jgi:hypothetical protein